MVNCETLVTTMALFVGGSYGLSNLQKAHVRNMHMSYCAVHSTQYYVILQDSILFLLL
jgi:hypothetical protein